MITEKQFAEQEATYALKQLKEAFTKRANAMRDMADALDKRVEELGKPNEIKGMRITDADRSNWAVNEIENLIRNLNFSELCRLTASLTLAQYKSE